MAHIADGDIEVDIVFVPVMILTIMLLTATLSLLDLILCDYFSVSDFNYYSNITLGNVLSISKVLLTFKWQNRNMKLKTMSKIQILKTPTDTLLWDLSESTDRIWSDGWIHTKSFLY